MYRVFIACLLTMTVCVPAYAKSAGEKKVEVIKALVVVCQLPEYSHLELCQMPDQP